MHGTNNRDDNVDPWKWRQYGSPKRRQYSLHLHGAIIQKQDPR